MKQECTVLEMLEYRAMHTPERTCVIYDSETSLSFGEFWELSGRIYAWLHAQGVGAEDVVMYCLPRGIGLFACMAGTMRAGAAFVLTETGNNDQRTAFIREDCACKLFVDEDCWQQILRTDPMDGYVPVELHHLCYIAYTSGTTGHPKGVLHEYGTMENSWKSIRIDGQPLLNDTDTFLAMSPLNFVSQPILFSAMCAFGTALAIMPYEYRETEEKFYGYLTDVHVNSGYLTPSFLRSHYPFRQPWRMCILSSEPADGLFIEDMEVYNCYASTESGCLITVFALDRPMTPAPVGKSGSDLEILVLNEEGTEVPAGEEGEICFRNPYMRGYLNLPERTRELLRGRIFHSGDAGEIAVDGNLIVHGRLDEMFKIGGYRIEPDEVANAVRKVCGLKHIVVRGFVLKDISSIIVFYTDDAEIDAEDMHMRLLKVLPEYMVPTSFVHLQDFPLLKTGKLDKLKLLPPEGSWAEFHTQSCANLPLIGKGRTAAVYDLGCKVLKLCKPSVPFTLIRQELVLTDAAHACGIDAPNAYEIVRSGASYGIIMDKLSGEVLEQRLAGHPEDTNALMAAFAVAARRLHRTSVHDSRFPDLKQVSMVLCDNLPLSYCTAAEAAKIKAVFETIPDAQTFVHGDLHPANVLIHGSKIHFIDLLLCGRGHPIFDLMCMYSHCVFLPSISNGKDVGSAELLVGEDLFDAFLKAYCSDMTPEELADVKRQIAGFLAARICTAAAALPGLFSDQVLREAKSRALEFYDWLSDFGFRFPCILGE